MTRRSIGLDPSFSGFGIADGTRSIAVGARGETLREKCRSLYAALSAFVYPYQDEPMLWVVEKPMPSERNVMHLYNMGHLMSHVYDLAENLDVKILEVPAGTLKIFVCGRGNANKVDVAVWALKRWNVSFDNDLGGNRCDAYALYQFGEAHLRGENPGVRPAKPKRKKAAA